MENQRWNNDTNRFDPISHIEIGGEGVNINPKKRNLTIKFIVAVIALAVGMICGYFMGQSDCL